MLAAQSIQQLVNSTKVNRAFAGRLFPANNNQSAFDLECLHSITVVDDSNTPVALGIFHSYTPNQVYCSIIACSNDYNNKYVNLELISVEAKELGVNEDVEDNHSVYRIARAVDSLPNLSSYHAYYTAFAEPDAKPLLQAIVDELIEQTIGNRGFDMRRNITVDLYDSEAGQPEHSTNTWRDDSGFVVIDKHRFFEVEAPRTEVLKAFESTPSDDFKFISLDQKSSVLFFDYDANMAVVDRQNYLEFLFAIPEVQGTVALDDDQQPVGYIISLGDRVLQLYSDNDKIATELLYNHLQTLKTETVKLFTIAHRESFFNKLSPLAKTLRRVQRYHTRLIPSNVTWKNVYALNMGAHLY